MPRLVPTPEVLDRRRTIALDHPRNVCAAWRDGKRRARNRYAYPDPWLWEDHPATLAAYLVGFNGEPRP